MRPADLVRPHVGDVYGAALWFLGDAEEAREATRAAFARAWRGIDDARASASAGDLRAWLLRLGMIEARRRPGAAAGEDGGAGAAAGRGPGGRGRELAGAVRELGPGEREALILRDVAGLSAAEAAEAMGIGEAPFRGRLHRARLAVARAVEGAPEGDGEPPAEAGWLERRRFARDHRRARAGLSAYLDGEQGADERGRLEAHAAACAECGALLAGLRRTRAELGELGRDPAPPPGLADEVEERLSEGA